MVGVRLFREEDACLGKNHFLHSVVEAVRADDLRKDLFVQHDGGGFLFSKDQEYVLGC